MPIKVGFVSLGCSKNMVDTEYMLGDLNKDGDFSIVADENESDVVVINTCAFIEAAKEEAINTILEFVEKKKENLKAVIVTGCLAQRYKKEILEKIPEVDAVLEINSQQQIKKAIKNSLKKNNTKKFYNEPTLKTTNCEKVRVISTPNHYAYLKIAEGCNNFCSYCAIPYIRGRFKSKPIEEILKEAKWLEEKNVKELILIAQNTAYYGLDLYNELKLEELLKKLSKLNFKWIRLLYLYPELIKESLIKTIAKTENILPYFDLPIQHINDEILEKMNRKTNSKQIIEKINLIRKIIPNATIRTSLIAGFPGETEEQFNELLNFVKKIKFNRLGCFKYSNEEGTKSFNFKNQINEKVKLKRTQLIYEESEKIIIKQSKEEISKNLTVIVDEKQDENKYIGRTKKDAPDVDCLVCFNSSEKLKNGDFVKVKITATQEENLVGEFLNKLC